MRIGSLFAGVGGLEMGLEASIDGASTIWQVEQDPYARQVLERHWPEASRTVLDVRKGNSETLAPVDLICGGFPCQSISNAGKKDGFKEGSKSSLWFEMSRILGEIRPRFVVLENVANITAIDGGRVLGRVLGDLASMGYDAEWYRLGASDVGAPHRRWRWFLIGWLPSDCMRQIKQESGTKRPSSTFSPINGEKQSMADSLRGGQIPNGERSSEQSRSRTPNRPPNGGRSMADTDRAQCEGERMSRGVESEFGQSNRCGNQKELADTLLVRQSRQGQPLESVNTKKDNNRKTGESFSIDGNQWKIEPALGRVVNGFSARAYLNDRLRCLGNAVVPACAFVIGRRLQEIREILDAS
jgi:DNA (cytosine-5)-methyltransferase 1